MKSKIANAVLTTFGILLLICSITFTVFAYVGQVPFLPAKNNIVANAAVGFDGQMYEDIPFETYEEVPQPFFSVQRGSDNLTFNLNNFVFDAQNLYCILFTCIIENYEYEFVGYFYPINSYDPVYVDNENESCIGGFALVPLINNGYYSYHSYSCYVYHVSTSSDLFIVLYDIDEDFLYDYDYTFNFYKVPQQVEENTSTTESLTDILGNSINFSTSAITTSVKEVFEGLFVNENNTISNYATYVVWFSGIAIALGFFKYILRFILTMGDKK